MATSKLSAIVNAKCPKCRRGKIFSNSMYGFAAQQTNEVCPHCGQRFEIEPGYFYAAMYVSYAMSVGEMLCLAFLTYYISGGSESPWTYIITIVVGSFILAPFNYRYSRVFLLHWLSPKIKYNSFYDRP